MATPPLRIAIADDEVDMRDYLCRMLPRLGHEVVAVAADGDQLIAACRQCTPDLIITDVKMPNRDGLSAVEELWHESTTPVIFISAFPQELTGHAFSPETHAITLVKPIKRSDLEPAIARAMTSGI